MTKVHEIFGNFGEEMNMIELAYLYTLNDYTTSMEDERTFSKYGLTRGYFPSGDPPGLEPPSNFENFNAELVSCIKEVFNKSEVVINKPSFYDGAVQSHKNKLHHFPCQSLRKFPSCNSYCSWHEKYFIQNNKEELFTIMKYALPQRMIKLDTTDSEQKVAKKIFGDSHVKESPKLITPISMAIFCHKIDDGFLGDEIGINQKVCNDFFPTPTDQGICLTRNFKLDDIMKFETSYETVFETSQQVPNSNINGGTLWSETTLVIFTDATNFLSQSYPRESNIDLGEIQLQLHQPNELGKMLTESNYEENLVPLKLHRGTEYFISIDPKGQIVSQEMKDLEPMERKCYLEGEVSDSSLFKVYTENNCKYECLVSLAKERCKCIPWDFFSKERNEQECDVFGRSCFYDALANLTQAPENNCKHCIQECDFIKYNKRITKEQTFPVEYYTDDFFEDYLFDNNNTFAETGFKKGFDSFTNRRISSSPGDSNEYSILRGYLIEDMIIVHLKFQQPDIGAIDIKYTMDDKIAKFGGIFGIFSQTTGCTFLGILNILILLIKLFLALIKT